MILTVPASAAQASADRAVAAGTVKGILTFRDHGDIRPRRGSHL